MGELWGKGEEGLRLVEFSFPGKFVYKGVVFEMNILQSAGVFSSSSQMLKSTSLCAFMDICCRNSNIFLYIPLVQDQI